MFRLANHTDDKIDELYTYLSTTASKVIYNALDIWAGSLPAIFDIYLTEFAGPPISENDTDFFEGISQYLSANTVRSEINAMVDRMKTGRRLIKEDGVGKDYANWLAHTIQRIDQMDLWSSEEAGYDSLFFWDDDYEIVFSGTFVEGIRSLVSGTGAILGYSYENVKGIFTDIGLKAPLLLVGSEAAFDITSEVTQERRADIMKEMPFN
ncbi:MAG: hypothetical protein IJI25_00400 [Eubacterium sp.]|nr:hypothetical protein [Eubacterium sp.]